MEDGSSGPTGAAWIATATASFDVPACLVPPGRVWDITSRKEYAEALREESRILGAQRDWKDTGVQLDSAASRAGGYDAPRVAAPVRAFFFTKHENAAMRLSSHVVAARHERRSKIRDLARRRVWPDVSRQRHPSDAGCSLAYGAVAPTTGCPSATCLAQLPAVPVRSRSGAVIGGLFRTLADRGFTKRRAARRRGTARPARIATPSYERLRRRP